MIPENKEQMIHLIVSAGMTRAYGDLGTAARRGRLTEPDIARIEQAVLDAIGTGGEFAQEFETFEAEVAVGRARELLKQFFSAARNGRLEQLNRKPKRW